MRPPIRLQYASNTKDLRKPINSFPAIDPGRGRTAVRPSPIARDAD